MKKKIKVVKKPYVRREPRKPKEPRKPMRFKEKFIGLLVGCGVFSLSVAFDGPIPTQYLIGAGAVIGSMVGSTFEDMG